MRRFIIAVLLILAVATGLALRPGGTDFAATAPEFGPALAQAETEADRGVATFAFGDWGALSSDTLRTSAAPWKLVNAAMALQAAEGDVARAAGTDIAALYRRFGFHSPEGIGNWPAHMPVPDMQSPLGLSVGTGGTVWPPSEVTISNIGCAACHTSVMYDETGAPDTTRVWLGMPNGSINLEVYTQALFTAVRDHGQEVGPLMEVMAGLYPDTSLRERLTLRLVILPILRDVIAEADDAYGRLLPFRASLAGATNGLDSLQNRLGLIPEGTVLTESIFNSVPDLGGRLWRTMLLNSGSYAIPGADPTRTIEAHDITPEHRQGLAGIIAYFTVPSMGVTEAVAEAHIPDAVAITAWMAEYRPQPYPGRIDLALAARGRALYAEGCADCHGRYDDSLTEPALLSFPNTEDDLGTDVARAMLLRQEIADTVNGGPFGRYITARTVNTYTAPPLTGLWASAPYLHNGSVPTLWHLLRPEARPAVFDVGGHRLDLDRVGIDLDPPDGYAPWSDPVTIDTSAFGLSNGGHEAEFVGLTGAEKDALLEYLKLL